MMIAPARVQYQQYGLQSMAQSVDNVQDYTRTGVEDQDAIYKTFDRVGFAW